MSMKIEISSADLRKLDMGGGWVRRYVPTMKRAMKAAIALIHGQIRRNLSGPSHTLFPGNGNPFPGTITGRLKNSVHGDPIVSLPDGFMGRVGPNTEYAAKQNRMRPYLAPALDSQFDAVTETFDKAIASLLRS